MIDIGGRLVTLNGLNEHSKANWPTLGHYVGTMGLLVRIEEDHGEGHKNNYVVQFDPSASNIQENVLDRTWMVEENEISYIALIPGTHALFRVNETDVPDLVIITEFDDVTDERPYRIYSFIVMAGGAEFKDMPEKFLRPYPYSQF